MLLQPITVPFSKSTLKPSVYTLSSDNIKSVIYLEVLVHCIPDRWSDYTLFRVLLQFLRKLYCKT